MNNNIITKMNEILMEYAYHITSKFSNAKQSVCNITEHIDEQQNTRLYLAQYSNVYKMKSSIKDNLTINSTFELLIKTEYEEEDNLITVSVEAIHKLNDNDLMNDIYNHTKEEELNQVDAYRFEKKDLDQLKVLIVEDIKSIEPHSVRVTF